MIPASFSPMANHVWQSTLFAAAVWLSTFAMRKNRAAVRYWFWLTASIKFLIPFSLLTTFGSQLRWPRSTAILKPQITNAVTGISRPFVITAEFSSLTVPQSGGELSAVLVGVWFSGIVFGFLSWYRLFRRAQVIRRAATPLSLNLPIPVMSSTARVEPGIFGIVRPVLILPEGITARLTSAQLDTILRHGLCHVRRRDNLTAAIHMLVEVIFWFHPLVWWIRMQLVAERERACDEEVVRISGNPQVYAEGILSVCRFFLESPGPCVSGVTGANLRRRIAEIMAGKEIYRMSCAKMLLLLSAGLAVVSGPIVLGVLQVPGQAQTQVANPSARSFEVASIKPGNADSNATSGIKTGHGRLDAENVTLQRCIMGAYGVGPQQISGGPDWLASDRFDISAKADQPVDDDAVLMTMLQSLLAERFKLTIRREKKTVRAFVLEVAKNGPKLEKAPPGEAGTNTSSSNTGISINAHNTDMDAFARILARQTDLPVVNQTGLEGIFNFKLTWTPERARPANGGAADAPSLFTAIQEQLGLRLRQQNAPVEMLVIDHAEKPTAN